MSDRPKISDQPVDAPSLGHSETGNAYLTPDAPTEEGDRGLDETHPDPEPVETGSVPSDTGWRRSLLVRIFERKRPDPDDVLRKTVAPEVAGSTVFTPALDEPSGRERLVTGLKRRLNSLFRSGSSERASSENHAGPADMMEDVAEPAQASGRRSEPHDRRHRLFSFRRKRPRSAGVIGPDKTASSPLESAIAVPSEAGETVPPTRARPTGMSRRSSRRGFPPIQVLIGWIGESAQRDVFEHARGFAQDHMESLETAWIAMAEFRGGTLFEVHEGGNGQAYLPDLIEELSRDPEQVLWVPSGTKLNRVVTLSLVEGRPFSMMLNEADSARVRASGQAPIERTGRMRRMAPRGTVVLVVGASLFTIALGSLGASAYLSAAIDQQPLPALSYNAETLPHGQIVTLSTALREDRWVSRIVFENGAWRAEFETFDDLVLPTDTEEAQRLIDEAVDRDLILQQERDRKIEELRSE